MLHDPTPLRIAFAFAFAALFVSSPALATSGVALDSISNPDPASSIETPVFPRVQAGELEFKLDDGTVETAYGVISDPDRDRSYAAVYLNRFTVKHPVHLDTVSIYWPFEGANVPAGLEMMVVAYYDADGDGNPSNAVRLGADVIGTTGAPHSWKTYDVDFDIPGAGDFYVGFVNLWARIPDGVPLPLQYPGSVDRTIPRCRSYMIWTTPAPDLVNYDDLGANTIIMVLQKDGQAENLMIRATADSYSGTALDLPGLIFEDRFEGQPCVIPFF